MGFSFLAFTYGSMPLYINYFQMTSVFANPITKAKYYYPQGIPKITSKYVDQLMTYALTVILNQGNKTFTCQYYIYATLLTGDWDTQSYRADYPHLGNG